MSERKIIRTKFIPSYIGPEGPLPHQTPSAKNIEIYEYHDGSKDVSYSNTTEKRYSIAPSEDIVVFPTNNEQTPRIPVLIKRKPKEELTTKEGQQGVLVEGVMVEMESKLNEYTTEITARCIREHDGISRKELAEIFGIDQGMTARIVKKLIHEGRVVHGGDRMIKEKGRPVRELHYNNDYQEPEDKKSIKELVSLKEKGAFGNMIDRHLEEVAEFIQNNPGTSQKQISRELELPSAATTGIVKKLVAVGKTVKGPDIPRPKGHNGRPEVSLFSYPKSDK